MSDGIIITAESRNFSMFISISIICRQIISCKVIHTIKACITLGENDVNVTGEVSWWIKSKSILFPITVQHYWRLLLDSSSQRAVVLGDFIVPCINIQWWAVMQPVIHQLCNPIQPPIGEMYIRLCTLKTITVLMPLHFR